MPVYAYKCRDCGTPLEMHQEFSDGPLTECPVCGGALRKQYGSDKQGFSQAMMAMQKERGVNPLAGCLPILPQIPIFIGLFHVLRRIAPGKEGLYSWDFDLTQQAASAKLFGAPIAASFNMMEPKQGQILALTDGSYTNIRIVAMILIIIMITVVVVVAQT